MLRRVALIAPILFLIAPAVRGQQGSRPVQTAAAAPAAADFDRVVKPFIENTCLDCHSTKKKKGNFDLEQYQTRDELLKDAEKWEEVVRKLRAGEMPPEDEPRPDPVQVKAVAQWVDRTITRAEIAAARDPGRVTTRRLNRTEYNNTVRDLLGVDIRPADDFPQDDSGYGFDNIGDVLSLSPVLMERYVSAADRVVRTAVFGVEEMKPTLVRLNAGQRKIPRHTEPLMVYDVSGLTMPNALHGEHHFPVDGEYVFRLALGGERPAGSEPLPVTLWIDGQEVKTGALDPDGGASFFTDRQDFSGKTVEFRLKMTSGNHWVAAAVPRLFEGLPTKYNGPNPSKRPPPPPEEFRPPPNATPERIARARAFFEQRQKEVLALGEPRVSFVEIMGPYEQAKGASAESLSRIFTCGHVHGGHQPWCERKIVSSFARRAFRRPVQPTEVDRYLKIADLAKQQGESFEEQIAIALQAILVSPDFLFRIETDHPVTQAAMAFPIGQHELATRLSYFLWASTPDEALLSAADRGVLRQPAVLSAQVRRMLKDPKAATIAEEFGGQWLQVRALESLTRDTDKFPAFENYLRLSMQRETELFFAHIISEDRSILDFLDARYTFVNERLAKHYGIPGVTGPEFRRVALDDKRRGGVLTQASVLTVSSYATRTSPVLRGRWVLDNILGSPPADPPPDVPNLDDTGVGTSTSMRQQLETHRKNAICASCHKRMDPLGFGLENFDATGAWRTEDGKFAIDSTGVLPDGREFHGPDELRAILTGDKDAFARTITTKLMTYALGRGLERYDRHAVKTIASRVAQQDYRFSSLVIEIVRSRPFQMRRGVTP